MRKLYDMTCRLLVSAVRACLLVLILTIGVTSTWSSEAMIYYCVLHVKVLETQNDNNSPGPRCLLRRPRNRSSSLKSRWLLRKDQVRLQCPVKVFLMCLPHTWPTKLHLTQHSRLVKVYRRHQMRLRLNHLLFRMYQELSWIILLTYASFYRNRATESNLMKVLTFFLFASRY